METTRHNERRLLISHEILSLIESLSVLRRLVNSGTSPVDEAAFCRQVTDNLLQQAGIACSCLFLKTDQGLEYAAGSEEEERQSSAFAELLKAFEELASRSIGGTAPEGPDICRRFESDSCSLAIPLQYAREPLGSIVLHCTDNTHYQPWHDRLHGLCADIIAQSLVTLRLVNRLHQRSSEQDRQLDLIDDRLKHEILRRESAESTLLREREHSRHDNHTDGQTGLLNQETFHRHLCSVVAVARDRGQESSLLLLDVDHFQVINEVAGPNVSQPANSNGFTAVAGKQTAWEPLCPPWYR
ncbi:MAG: GGDEF domain-containing protein [Gammaproteobacteria bacterium]|nr:GGDEF domain-containing protein [Gammaproteobacteria bacterium]